MIGKVNEYLENRKIRLSNTVKDASHLPESVLLVQCCCWSNNLTTRCFKSPPEAAIAMLGMVW